MTVYNESKNSVTVVNELKAGSGWDYDAPFITYDGETDPITGMPVYYDGVGFVSTVYNESKNSVSVTNESKNLV